MARAIRLKDLPKSVRAKLSPRQKERLSKEQKSALKALRDARITEQRETFYRVLDGMHLPRPVAEHRFHDDRKWRFDFAWPDAKIALEVDGAIWTQGRHTRGEGWLKDTEKMNTAATMGWRVLRCTPDSLTSRSMQEVLRRVLK